MILEHSVITIVVTLREVLLRLYETLLSNIRVLPTPAECTLAGDSIRLPPIFAKPLWMRLPDSRDTVALAGEAHDRGLGY